MYLRIKIFGEFNDHFQYVELGMNININLHCINTYLHRENKFMQIELD